MNMKTEQKDKEKISNFNTMNMSNKQTSDQIQLEAPYENRGIQAISLDELLSMDFPANKWAVDKIVPHEGITILSGAPASYKTWLLLRMAMDIAKGESFLDQFPCQQSGVLIIDEENHLRLLQDRLQLMGTDHDLPIYFLSQKGFIVSDKRLINQVLKICQEKDIGVIFIDSLVRINNAEENDASQMAAVFRCIRQLCQNQKTLIITHHERKEGETRSSAQNRLRGSSDISASVDAHISVRRSNSDKSTITIEQAKLRGGIEMEPFRVAVQASEEKVGFQYLGACQEEVNKKELAKEAILTVLDKETSGLSRSEICKQVKAIRDIGEKNIRSALDALIQEKVVQEKQGAKNTKLCCLPKLSDDNTPPTINQ